MRHDDGRLLASARADELFNGRAPGQAGDPRASISAESREKERG